jgi:hypothetical protein
MSDRFSIGTAIAGRRSLHGSEIAPLGVFRGLRLANSQNDELSHFEVFSVLFGRNPQRSRYFTASRFEKMPIIVPDLSGDS